MKIAVIGAGYVGIHSILNLSKLGHEVIGYDINEEKVGLYKKGIDVTKEVGDEEIANSNATFTSDHSDLVGSEIFIVAVPTDVNHQTKELILTPLVGASETISKYLSEDSIVVYESTVYPGLTEEICIPLLEKENKLKCGVNFDVVYTPERVDPGNKVNTVLNTPRVISGTRDKAVDIIIDLYSKYISKMVKVSSIKVAESVKILENTQRDINIALMNNFAMLTDKLEISFDEVLNAASTKWNFLNFTPGLVGGHCIGIDTKYLIKKMEVEGIDVSYLRATRAINEEIIDLIYKKITEDYYARNVLYIGCAFKPNTNDIRNSKHINLINKLKETHNVDVFDPMADYENCIAANDIDFTKYDVIVNAINHTECDYSILDEIPKDKYVVNLVRGKILSDKQWNLM